MCCFYTPVQWVTPYQKCAACEKMCHLPQAELTFGWSDSFAAVADECRAAREGVALFDQSYFGKPFAGLTGHMTVVPSKW